MAHGTLDEIRKNWEELAKNDPMFAILTNHGKENNGWDPEEFFASGDGMFKVIEDTKNFLKFKGVDAFKEFNKSLDFGCGVGRNTSALSKIFKESVGVDISENMLNAAKTFKQNEKCKFVLNTKNDLSVFKDNEFDFIYSIIVLQHMNSKIALNYIKEFERVLKPGGVLYFHIPTGYSKFVDVIVDRNSLNQFPRMEMHVTKIEDILKAVPKLHIIRTTSHNDINNDYVDTFFTFVK